MGIRVDFFIKHVRPADMEAWAMICQNQGPGSLAAWLLANGVVQADIDQAFNDWAALALLDPSVPENEAAFVRAAQDISQARWSEFYPTNDSTIMFLNAPLLKELSVVSAQEANQDFDFDPQESIPLAITINNQGQAPVLVRNAHGAALAADAAGDCCHFSYLITEGASTMTAMSSEAIRRARQATTLAEASFKHAGEQAAAARLQSFFGIEQKLARPPETLAALAAAPASQDDLNALLNSVGAAPGATTSVTVPSVPASGDVTLVQNVQTLDSYIAVLTALVMYNNHPAPYNLSDPQQAAQFVIDLANARNFVVTGGTIKAIPMYLPMGEATTQTLNKSVTSADLHMELLTALFGALGLPPAVLAELDGILTEVSGSLKNLKLSFETQTQTLNHFVSFYYLTPVPGSNPPINQMNVEFIYLQLAQSSWKASAGKSSVDHFTLDLTTTRTTATMSAGIVAANAANIVNSLLALTGNDATTISEMTKMKGVKT